MKPQRWCGPCLGELRRGRAREGDTFRCLRGILALIAQLHLHWGLWGRAWAFKDREFRWCPQVVEEQMRWPLKSFLGPGTCPTHPESWLKVTDRVGRCRVGV